MNKYIVIKNKYLPKYILISIIIGVFLNYIEINQNNNIEDISYLFINNYALLYIGYLNVNILQMIRWIIIQMFLILELYDYISKYFGVCSQFIFTRTSKRSNYFFMKIIEVFFIIFLFYLIQFFITYAIGFLYGMEIGNTASVIKMIIILCIYSTLMIVILNIISILKNSRFAILFVLFIEVAPLLMIDLFIKLNVKLNEVVRFIPSLNALMVTNPNNMETVLTLHDKYSYKFSSIYIFILLLITIFIGCIVMKKIDLLGGQDEISGD